MTMHHFTLETADYTGYLNNTESGRIKIESDNEDATHRIGKALSVFYNQRDELQGKFHDLLENQDDDPLLFYPFSVEDSKDLKRNNHDERFILEMTKANGDAQDYQLKTGCLMGFISATFTDDDGEEYHFNIYIHSRFDYVHKSPVIHYDGTDELRTEEDGALAVSEADTSPNGKDFFLHYMLQRVLNINVSRNVSASANDSNRELMLYFFPAMLRRAMRQGFYKHYVHREFNDDRVRGTIDVSRHIARNNPFCGKIAYSATEYDYDNPLTQLVRHTIEYIRHHEWASDLLSQSVETQNDVRIIVENTERYQANERQRIIRQNINRIHHPFYSEWRQLQHLCLTILRYDDVRYDRASDEDRIHGLLFDGPWLWENYLNTVFMKNNLGFVHPDNTKCTGGVYDGRTDRYPDFYLRNDQISNQDKNSNRDVYAKEIWDAKYKPGYEDKHITSDDRLQLMGYMYIMSKKFNLIGDTIDSHYDCYLCTKAGVVSPIRENESGMKEDTSFTGLGGTLYRWQLRITSSENKDFVKYKDDMEINEKAFLSARESKLTCNK